MEIRNCVLAPPISLYTIHPKVMIPSYSPLLSLLLSRGRRCGLLDSCFHILVILFTSSSSTPRHHAPMESRYIEVSRCVVSLPLISFSADRYRLYSRIFSSMRAISVIRTPVRWRSTISPRTHLFSTAHFDTKGKIIFAFASSSLVGLKTIFNPTRKISSALWKIELCYETCRAPSYFAFLIFSSASLNWQ